MGDTLTCDNCGQEIESADDLEEHEVPEIETKKDGSLNLWGNNNLYLCKNCRRPLGVSRRSEKRGE
ncbi:MAG: hypothetical protein V5A52_06905 [Halovenus sp.]